jgi:hypothetical protein
MKIFLFTALLHDGGHEHRNHVMIRAKDLNTAWKIGKEEMHDLWEEDNGKYWNYGDGLTATTPKYIQEIDQEEAEVLNRLNIVYYLNKKRW